MSSNRGRDDASKDGPLELAGLLLIVAAVMIFLVWMAASARIVAVFTPMLRWLGALWTWLPGELGAPSALQLYRSARVFLQRPDQVDFFSFALYVNLAITPLTTLCAGGVFIWFCLALVKPKANVFRRFKDADDLLSGVSRIFTGTAPILHIRKDIAQHKDPRWARQRFPQEVLFEERVDGSPLVGRDANDLTKQVARPEVIERWFKGLEPSPGWAGQKGGTGNGRWVSRTLGRQIVDLTSDQDKAMFSAQAQNFTDRLSDVGKVMFGLLCAHAFGGKDGMDDYRRARDELNNSCRGAKHGLPNLQVAQWIVDKYRSNDLARRLFAVHHWEYTYLFELFVQAKRRGKLPDSEFRWLKPADRILWYVLNTVGRFTPHTESAAAFNMHAFERKCARLKRWPLRVNGQTNKYEPSIFVQGAVDGLVLEFDRWMAGTDENDDEWWKDTHQWLSPSRSTGGALSATPLPPDTEASRQMASTAFDQAESAAREKAELQQQRQVQGELDSLFGLPSSAAGARGSGAGSGVL
jgi:hypothetical protein